MQSSIPKGQLNRFKDVSEGNVYYLQFLEIKPARELFRAVNHQFEASFTRWTKVIEINPVPDTFPLCTYTLKSFQTILNNIADKTCLADILGVVTGVSPGMTVDVKGQPTPKRTVRITDTRLQGTSYPIEWMTEQGRQSGSNEIENTTVIKLASCVPHMIMNKFFRCKISIDSIAPNQSWWFLSCEACTWKSVPDGDTYKCTKSTCGNRTAAPRYKLPIIASDGNCTVEMVLFGDLAEDLVGKQADIVLAQSYGISEGLPSEISKLVGRALVVDVSVSRISFQRDDISFKVRKFYPEGSLVFTEFTNIAESSGTTEEIKRVEAQDFEPSVTTDIKDPTPHTPPSAILTASEQEQTEQTKRRRTTSRSKVPKKLFLEDPKQVDTSPL